MSVSDTFIGDCDNCSTEDIKVKTFEDRNHKYTLCEICSKTFFSHALYYPTQCSMSLLFRSLPFCVNIILKAIRENRGNEQSTTENTN